MYEFVSFDDLMLICALDFYFSLASGEERTVEIQSLMDAIGEFGASPLEGRVHYTIASKNYSAFASVVEKVRNFPSFCAGRKSASSNHEEWDNNFSRMHSLNQTTNK
jgi:hypothetical protein